MKNQKQNNMFCLTRDQIILFFNYYCNDNETLYSIAPNLERILKFAENYEYQTVIFSYFVSKIFDSDRLVNSSSHNIEIFYEKVEDIWLHIEEFDYNFINYLLLYNPNSKIELDEDLLIIYEKYKDYKYE